MNARGWQFAQTAHNTGDAYPMLSVDDMQTALQRGRYLHSRAWRETAATPGHWLRRLVAGGGAAPSGQMQCA